MFEVFKRYLEDKISLTSEEWSKIKSVCTEKRLRKRQYLLQEGDVWRLHVFICKGLLRSYIVDDKGAEHIMQFAPENHWTGDRESLTTGNPSVYNIDALEDSDLIITTKPDFDELCQTIPAFNEMINTILQRSFLVSQQRIQASISYSAEQKYDNFLTKFPSVANRVPLHMIASYLGISAETISRIRKVKK